MILRWSLFVLGLILLLALSTSFLWLPEILRALSLGIDGFESMAVILSILVLLILGGFYSMAYWSRLTTGTGIWPWLR